MDSTRREETVDSALWEDPVDYTSLVRSLFESEDWQPLIDHLAEDVVFKATIPDGTPISGEFRGKQAVAKAPHRGGLRVGGGSAVETSALLEDRASLAVLLESQFAFGEAPLEHVDRGFPTAARPR